MLIVNRMNETDSSSKEPLDSRQLLAFLHLSRLGSFTAAGKELHLTQSAVSRSIRALEEAVGCRLFDRVGKKAHLSLAGEHLLHHARRVFQEMQIARESLTRLGKWGKSRLRLGASPTACQYLIPPVLRQFKAVFPDCQLSIQPSDTPVLVEALRRRQIDVALALRPFNPGDFEVYPLFEDELHFVMAPNHPWVLAGRVCREEIPRQNYILYHGASQTGQLVDDHFRRERISPNRIIEVGGMEVIKELVKLGLGISIFAPWIARAELEAGTLVTLPLGRRKLVRSWAVLQLKGSRPGLADEQFLACCRAVVSTLNLQTGPTAKGSRI